MAAIDLEKIPVVALTKLSEYLLAHEDDIANRINDFEELWPIFFYFFDRHPCGFEPEIRDIKEFG